MPGLLFETDPSVDGGIGFGVQPGIGFSWGCDVPLHTWYTWPAGFLNVGAAFMSFGGFGRDWGNTLLTSGITLTAIDSINQDQTGWEVGPIFHPTGAGFGPQINPSLIANDVSLNGTGATNPIPSVWGGNGIKSFAVAFVPGVTFAGGVYDPSTGNTSVAGMGFQPDIVVFYGNTSNGADSGGLRFMVGVMDKFGNQWVESTIGIFQSGPLIIGGVIGVNTRFSEFRTDSCILGQEDLYGSPGGSTQGRNRASFVSMDSDGFTVHSDESNTPYGGTLAMAYKLDDPTKGFIQAGSSIQGDSSVSGLPMDPSGVVLVGDSWSNIINGPPPSNRTIVSMGGFDTVLNRSSVSGSGNGSAIPGGYYDDSAIVFGDPQTATIFGRALAAITSDGWNYTWTDDDGGARPFGYIAFNVPNRGNPSFNNFTPV